MNEKKSLLRLPIIYSINYITDTITPTIISAITTPYHHYAFTTITMTPLISPLHTICINSNCGGTSTGFSSCPTWSSFSTARSQTVIWLSEPDAEKTELSDGNHSTDVIACVWCLNNATGSPLKWSIKNLGSSVKCLEKLWLEWLTFEIVSNPKLWERHRPHQKPAEVHFFKNWNIESVRRFPPFLGTDSTHLFQEMTFTSASCACAVNIHALDGAALMSHTLILWSTEHDAKT